MPTQTPTNNLPPVPEAQVPAGLPDLGALTQLANQLFSSLPGGGGVTALHAPSIPTSAPPPAEAAAVQTPQELQPAGVADGLDLGTPAAYTAAIPVVFPTAGGLAPSASGAPIPGSPTPYYFLGSPETQGAARGTEVPAASPQPYASTSDDLAAVFESVLKSPEPAARSERSSAAAAPTASRSSGHGFYFLEPGLARRDKAPDSRHQPSAQKPFDVQAVRRDFPILSERVNGKPLVWFDNAATTQKPRSVIERVSYFYEHENSNIHRAAHELAARATDAYENARNIVARFIGASAQEIIFVRGTTEGINLLANTFGQQEIGEGDEIIVSHLEHHANIVPWQLLAKRKGAKLRVIPVDDSGQIRLDEFAKLLNPRTKLVSITQVSNALGTVTPVAEVIALAHAAGVKVLVDGAQSIAHIKVDVRALDADFFVFSGHKIFGPTGIGVVYGKKALLDQLPPWQGGGNMIADVTFEHTVFQEAPARFEAGTGNIADAVGLGAALEYVERVGLDNIARYEHDLLEYATHGLSRIPGLRLIGTAAHKASVASFVLEGYRTEEVGAALNKEGIAVRSGHHCAQPILRRFGVEATVRPSFAFYNTLDEIDLLVRTVRKLAKR